MPFTWLCFLEQKFSFFWDVAFSNHVAVLSLNFYYPFSYLNKYKNFILFQDIRLPQFDSHNEFKRNIMKSRIQKQEVKLVSKIKFVLKKKL